MERVILKLPPALLRAVDEFSERQGRKRSQVVRQAIEELLDRERKREFEDLMAEGYREMAEHLAQSAAEFAVAQASATEASWK